MSDDADLARLFTAAGDAPADDPAFVAAVTRRTWWRRHTLIFAAGAALALLAVLSWATWPAAYDFSVATFTGFLLMANGVSGFFDSFLGAAVAAALVLSAAVWAWATGRLRGVFL
ncbi:MAG: hypothetical protein JO294_01125 [Alphaproteobacteria bacterium]|nr:hypothetical protein [Alphaproteobacteria bacterium]MBV9903901.1 hypothetical protein [Alphaproteobacteria bacterium]